MTKKEEYHTRADEKYDIDKKITKPHVKKGEIWNAKLGINIGVEENGKGGFLRPVLVMRNIGNLVFVLPTTTKGKDSNPFYHKLQSVLFTNVEGEKIDSRCILSQAKTIDPKRLIKYKGEISTEEHETIKKTPQRYVSSRSIILLSPVLLQGKWSR